uniref:Protein tweety homolog n=1 Tax=Panagrellus redivivus TaxID=6233 RepID=A0A7E4UPB1_PANRE
MSVDTEIAEIKLGLENVHQVLGKVSKQLVNATASVNKHLDVFDREVRSVERAVRNVKINADDIFQYFPRHTVYLAALLCIDALIWLLGFFLIYKIIRSYRQRWDRSALFQEKLKPTTVYDSVPTAEPSGQQLETKIPMEEVPNNKPYQPWPTYPSHPPPPYIRRPLARDSPGENEEASSLLDGLQPEARSDWRRVIRRDKRASIEV